MRTSLSQTLRDLVRRRYALWNLVLKDFRIRYRNMSLGVLWSLLNPLVMLGVLSFVMQFAAPQGGQRYFPVFILLGLVSFNFVSLSVSTGNVSLLENASLLRKVPFPRILLPISVVLSQVIHSAIQVLLVLAFAVAWRVPASPHLLWLPLIFAIEFAFVVGLVCLCSSLNVYFRDMRYLVESGLTVYFWFSPVFYPLDAVRGHLPHAVFQLYALNPLAGCIDAARDVVLEQHAPDLALLGLAAAVALVVLLVGFHVFARREGEFADYV